MDSSASTSAGTSPKGGFADMATILLADLLGRYSEDVVKLHRECIRDSEEFTVEKVRDIFNKPLPGSTFGIVVNSQNKPSRPSTKKPSKEEVKITYCLRVKKDGSECGVKLENGRHCCTKCFRLVDFPNVHAPVITEKYGYTFEEIIGDYKPRNGWKEPATSNSSPKKAANLTNNRKTDKIENDSSSEGSSSGEETFRRKRNRFNRNRKSKKEDSDGEE